MNYHIIPDKEALSQCAWCQNHINEHTEVFGLGAKLNPKVDLSDYESHCIQIDLLSEPMQVYMLVAARGSEAKENGNDSMFLLCSQECAEKLKGVLEEEISAGRIFDAVRFG